MSSHWAAADDSLLGRMKHLLSTVTEDGDVHFLVGDEHQKELLSAHKAILRTASDVFEAMFRFDAQKGKSSSSVVTFVGEVPQNAVIVPDVEPAVFRAILTYIYTDDFSGLSDSNLFEILYAAKKYHITGLIKSCVEFPIDELDNVFLALSQARLFEENGLASQCLAYIDQMACHLFLSEHHFLQIDQDFLCEILGRDELMVNSEINIWNAALRWADQQCVNNCKECSAENRRQMLGPALFKIRFPLISKREFCRFIVPSNILTNTELLSISLFHCCPDSNNDVVMPKQYTLQFSTRQRACNTKKRLLLQIDQFSKFAENENSKRYINVVSINGHKWTMEAYCRTQNFNAKQWLSLSLGCETKVDNEWDDDNGWCVRDDDDGQWAISCTVTCQILAQKEGTMNFVRESRLVFSNSAPSLRFANFISLEELMDSENGWFDEEKDTVILAIDVIMDEFDEQWYGGFKNRGFGWS